MTNLDLNPKRTLQEARKVGQFLVKKKKRDMPFFRLQTKYLPVGFNYGKTPFHQRFPIENYYKDIKYGI